MDKERNLIWEAYGEALKENDWRDYRDPESPVGAEPDHLPDHDFNPSLLDGATFSERHGHNNEVVVKYIIGDEDGNVLNSDNNIIVRVLAVDGTVQNKMNEPEERSREDIKRLYDTDQLKK